jgi:hypothetical protein
VGFDYQLPVAEFYEKNENLIKDPRSFLFHYRADGTFPQLNLNLLQNRLDLPPPTALRGG